MAKIFHRYWSSLVKKPLQLIRLNSPTDVKQYFGRTLMASPEWEGPTEPIVIENVQGCAAMGLHDQPEKEKKMLKFFQINGTHFCSMYSFYIQMLEDRIPSAEEEAEFDLASDIKKVKEIK